MPCASIEVELLAVFLVFLENQAQRLVGAVEGAFGMFLGDPPDIDEIVFRAGQGSRAAFIDQARRMYPEGDEQQRGEQPDRDVMA